MKRSSDCMSQSSSDINKKPRFSPSPFSDIYAQYPGMNPTTAAMMMGSQYPASSGTFAQPNAGPNGFVGQFSVANNGMYGAMGGYGGGPQSMMNPMGAGAGFSGAGFGPSGFAGNAVMGGSQGGQELSRTIYLGNVRKDASATEILNHVKTGVVESFKILPEKTCAFLSFLEPASAQMFYQEFLSKRLTVQDVDLKVGWGKPNPIPSNIQLAAQSGATRNVYLGQFDDSVTEDSLRQELSKFGEIEQIKLIREKQIAFVHYTSISAAIKCVSTLSQDPTWASRRVNYGKDRCAYSGKAAGGDQQQYNFNFQHPFRGSFGFDPYGGGAMNPASMMPQAYGANNGGQLRTLYLGNIPPEATCEDLCNAIRGGVLFQIRYLSDKHIAFVTFVDAQSAMNVYNFATINGLIVKSKRIRVGWGKPTSVPAAVVVAVQGGASRNIYIGGIENNFEEEKLRHDFEEYGEIELINTLKEKNCAFVNFTSVTNAMKALSAMKQHPDYRKYKINYGKDRCGNPPKRVTQQQHGQQTQQGQHHSSSQQYHHASPPSEDNSNYNSNLAESI